VSKKTTVKLTAHFEYNLETIESFLTDADASQAYDRLLDEFAGTLRRALFEFRRVAVLCAALGRVAQPRLLAADRGYPKGGKPGAPSFDYLSWARSRKVISCQSATGGFVF